MRTLSLYCMLVALTMSLAGCSSAYYASSGNYTDDLYRIHNRADIARREQAEAEARKAEAEARRAEYEAMLAEVKANDAATTYRNYSGGYSDNTSSQRYTYDNVLADTYESAYARRLRGFRSATYNMPSSYFNFRYGGAINYVSAYDPAFYNVMVMGSEVWVEPKYITSMFGSWGMVSVYTRPWYYGWNYHYSYYNHWWPSLTYSYWGGNIRFSYLLDDPCWWYGGFYRPFHSPLYGPHPVHHPYHGPNWGPGGIWAHRPAPNYYSRPGGRTPQPGARPAQPTFAPGYRPGVGSQSGYSTPAGTHFAGSRNARSAFDHNRNNTSSGSGQMNPPSGMSGGSGARNNGAQLNGSGSSSSSSSGNRQNGTTYNRGSSNRQSGYNSGSQRANEYNRRNNSGNSSNNSGYNSNSNNSSNNSNSWRNNSSNTSRSSSNGFNSGSGFSSGSGSSGGYGGGSRGGSTGSGSHRGSR